MLTTEAILLQLAICDISLSTRQVSHFPTRLAALGPMRLISGPGLYPHRSSHNVEVGMVHGGNGEREIKKGGPTRVIDTFPLAFAPIEVVGSRRAQSALSSIIQDQLGSGTDKEESQEP
jgi:hypothetical protein